MKIWELKSDFRDRLYCLTENGYRTYFSGQFAGEPIQKWDSNMEFDSEKRIAVDYPKFGSGIVILSERAVTVLKDLIESRGELLKLNHIRFAYYALNILNIVPGLDYKNSEITFFEDGSVWDIRKYAFELERVANESIFKIPERLSTQIFVTDTFRDCVLQHNLTGFRFIELWDSEADPAAQKMQRQRYLERLAEIERTKGPEYSFAEVTERMRKENKAAVSGKQKLQLDENDSLLIGDLLEDTLTYAWMNPIYIPPLFLDMKWHLAEKEPETREIGEDLPINF
ncbi:hypothetical protein SAMN05216312_110173 [Cohnella sp. OV330]|uniref:imm11 family protein n=1 Tax=Cohnella sp. OV330 TaxID=1855288 RepID=UPI0008F2964E|nr:DUF1629 domain-containing protein [Cohnella sp. OV330]SFB49999.1 hypothetical protein SAMN05216312_110173 [Cohnella sp. OV330]